MSEDLLGSGAPGLARGVELVRNIADKMHTPSNGGATSDERLTTGDMARLSGSTLRTVRFYEEEGLIEPEERSDGGHRKFSERQLARLRLALDLREAGLSLGDIKDLFDLKSSCKDAVTATDQMSGILERQIEEMQQKITNLRRLREELTAMVAAIAECRECDGVGFPEKCGECDVLDRDDVPRALRILWRD